MKFKMSVFKIAVAAAWAIMLVVVAAGTLWLSPSHKTAIQQAQQELLEMQDRLAFARSAQKETTKQRMRDRLAEAENSINAFSCTTASESALIFQIGQTANALQLQKFSSRFPDSLPEQTLDKTERIGEGWLTVEFVADYLKTAAFINSLERNTPVLFVESIQLTPADSEPGLAAVRINISYLIRKNPSASVAAAH